MSTERKVKISHYSPTLCHEKGSWRTATKIEENSKSTRGCPEIPTSQKPVCNTAKEMKNSEN